MGGQHLNDKYYLSIFISLPCKPTFLRLVSHIRADWQKGLKLLLFHSLINYDPRACYVHQSSCATASLIALRQLALIFSELMEYLRGGFEPNSVAQQAEQLKLWDSNLPPSSKVIWFTHDF